ncbi:tripartite tricarboxylate transporter substrate binding protein [Humitalea sp. 24SJ18S-53]|uniref:tripartite tricarboxylate transporter substrate binding protein n=1 Tax=Humitalea sp. 24SJ18S-53 TaxID=3422307 RepID=UPI003D665278
MDRPLLRRSLLGGLAALPALAHAQGRPNVRIVVPYPPGGTVDATARFIGARAAEILQQNWVIESRSGANGAIGADVVVRAAPDGLTLLYSNEVLLMLRHVQRNVPFNAVQDLSPIVRTAIVPQILVGSPRHTTEETLPALLEAIRKTPSDFTFATPTLGSLGQFGAAALGHSLGVDVTIVPYRGTAPAVSDILAGAVKLMISPAGGVLPLIRDGQLRALAVCSPQRIAALPDVPTLAESGFPELVFESWTGMWGPRGLPQDIAARVHAAVTTATNEPDSVRRILALGCTPINEPMDQMPVVIAREEARNPTLVRLARMTPE